MEVSVTAVDGEDGVEELKEKLLQPSKEGVAKNLRKAWYMTAEGLWPDP